MENELQQSSTSDEPMKLTYELIKEITNGLDKERLLGSGTFGKVYKGVYENGEEIAVKIFHNNLRFDCKDFLDEFRNLRGLNHKNVVKLVGFCNESKEVVGEYEGKQVSATEIHTALCFELVKNGSLRKHISDESTGLNWLTRYEIIKGICQGIKYLREGLKSPVLHLDLKPDNILLDKAMVPKIADFGLSRFFGEETTKQTISIVGTSGYLPPEYIEHQVISEPFDIFSLGVIITKIITGYEGYSSIVDMTPTMFAKQVYDKWRRMLVQILKPGLCEVYCHQVNKCIDIGMQCLKRNRKDRPTIQSIVSTLLETETMIKKVELQEDQQFPDRESVDTRNFLEQLHPENRIVMGIDLGTAYSRVGVWQNSGVEIVNLATPSCVAFTDHERLIGKGANNQVKTNASNTVFDVKRLMGRSFSDASVKSDAKYWPFDVTDGPDDKPYITVRYIGEKKVFSPEEISAMVLVKMKETAEAYAGVAITDAVITVPAYFNGSQRQATKDAGVIAGLNVLGIINDPTAAAITYSMDKRHPLQLINEPTAAVIRYSLSTRHRNSTVLVYDLGSGTLDVSLVRIKDGALQLQVIATAGDTHLGGEDFTNNMVDHFVNEFKNSNQRDISGDKRAIDRLRRSCEEAKRKLTTNPCIAVDLDALFEGIDFCSTITRDQFDQLNVDLFRKCMEPIAMCLVDAKMDKNEVDDVVLVGGSTRIPRLQRLIKNFFNGKELCRSINADEAVAYGATLQAALLTGTDIFYKVPPVIDITPFSYGIGILEGHIWEVIRRNTTIPATKEMTVTVKENQSSVVTVYEDENAMAKKFLDPNTKVRFQFHIDMGGILQVSVSAQDKEGRVTITNLPGPGRFRMVEIERMKRNALMYKEQDEEYKKNVKAWNDIQNLLCSISNNMKNLEDSAARLLLQPHENEGRPPISLIAVSKVKRKDRMNMIQAHNAANKKLQDSIVELQEMADGTEKWLGTKEPTTSEIIWTKYRIQCLYRRIIGQIKSAPPLNVE